MPGHFFLGPRFVRVESRFMARLPTKSPFLLLALGLWIFACLASSAEDDDPNALNQQVKQLIEEGRYPEAVPLAEKAVELAKRVYGPEHPYTATSLNNLGELRQAMGEYPKAEPGALLNDRQSVTKSKFFKNPMHRSGLALAGAQTTIEAWKREEVPPVENDGILTAEDVSTLDLEGTWLVTLSACDTGSGEARAGEGVMGLRRGFIQAGAQHLLMTLWPISDELAVQIMSDFYEAAHHSGNAPEALAEVQRHWLVKLRSEKGLAQVVNLAGPFIMSSQGKP